MYTANNLTSELFVGDLLHAQKVAHVLPPSNVAVNAKSNRPYMPFSHTQPFNSPLSGTTWVSRYQKKRSPTHPCEEEEGFAQTTRSALNQRGLLDPIKPACNQSRPDGWLKLTASAFN